MRKQCVLTFVLVLSSVLCFGCQSSADGSSSGKETPVRKAESSESASGEKAGYPGCTPEIRALADHAMIAFEGEGQGEIVVVTDPFCWHCRLGHSLLGESKPLYGTLKMVFFPRKGSMGSDMAAWVLEDGVGTDGLREMVDFAYSDLQRPKTDDPVEARMVVLAQFTERFPELLDGTTLEDLYVRLEKDHAAHAQAGADLARAADLPGTPVLIAGRALLVGYGAPQWEKAMQVMKVCE